MKVIIVIICRGVWHLSPLQTGFSRDDQSRPHHPARKQLFAAVNTWHLSPAQTLSPAQISFISGYLHCKPGLGTAAHPVCASGMALVIYCVVRGSTPLCRAAQHVYDTGLTASE
jgi:hypothetical protein